MNHLLLLPLFNYQPFGRLINVILHLKDINIIYCFSFLRRVARSRRQAESEIPDLFFGEIWSDTESQHKFLRMELLRQTQGLNCRDGDKFVFKCVYIERVSRFPERFGYLPHNFYLRHEWASLCSDFASVSEAIFVFQFQRNSDFFFLDNTRRYHRTAHKSTWVCIFCVFWLYHEIPSFSFSSMASCIIYFLNMIIGVWRTARLPGVLRARKTLSAIRLPCWSLRVQINFEVSLLLRMQLSVSWDYLHMQLGNLWVFVFVNI